MRHPEGFSVRYVWTRVEAWTNPAFCSSAIRNIVRVSKWESGRRRRCRERIFRSAVSQRFDTQPRNFECVLVTRKIYAIARPIRIGLLEIRLTPDLVVGARSFRRASGFKESTRDLGVSFSPFSRKEAPSLDPNNMEATEIQPQTPLKRPMTI